MLLSHQGERTYQKEKYNKNKSTSTQNVSQQQAVAMKKKEEYKNKKQIYIAAKKTGNQFMRLPVFMSNEKLYYSNPIMLQ